MFTLQQYPPMSPITSPKVYPRLSRNFVLEENTPSPTKPNVCNVLVNIIVITLILLICVKLIPMFFPCEKRNPTIYTLRNGVTPDTDAIEANSMDDIKQHDHVLVMFYATWCSHCTAFKQEFDNIARALHAKYGHKLRVMKIEQQKTNADDVNSLGVTGYPTIKLLNKNGKSQELPRSNADDFVKEHRDLWEMIGNDH